MSFSIPKNQVELYNLLGNFFDGYFLRMFNKLHKLYIEDDDYEVVLHSLEVMETMKNRRSSHHPITNERKQQFMKWYWYMNKPSWNMLLDFQVHFNIILRKFHEHLDRLPKDNKLSKYWNQNNIDDLNRLGELLSLYIQEVVQEPTVVKHVPIQNEMDVLKQKLERTKLELAKTKEELQKTKKELEEVREAYLKSIVWLDNARARTAQARMESDMIQRGCYPGLPKKWEDMTSLLNELNGLRM
jgi:hypothetical protein